MSMETKGSEMARIFVSVNFYSVCIRRFASVSDSVASVNQESEGLKAIQHC